uniref:Uncharacterized protein AlNc14C9G1188 n=1 Tax=Albugo laibachii Nc14 TaxID=890382 RepID=F0W2D8_9STRA|nr:conserved hypothetical protein [Albugo laibachii Nc14]|eukprot:CCA15223.1 conserved hypothetical protein [Albugo laibachii Nc14]
MADTTTQPPIDSNQRSVHVLLMPLPMTMSIQFEDGTRVAVNHGPAFVEIPIVISGSQEPNDVRRFLHELFMRHQNEARGPPPTSKTFLDNLPTQAWSAQDLAAKYSDCAICLSDYECDESVLRLPCEHLFHKECGMRWLAEHNVCPTCRFQLPAQEQEPDKVDRQSDAPREVGTQTNDEEGTSGEDSGVSRGQIRTHQQILATSPQPYRVVRRRISESTEAPAATSHSRQDLEALLDAEADLLVEECNESGQQVDVIDDSDIDELLSSVEHQNAQIE